MLVLFKVTQSPCFAQTWWSLALQQAAMGVMIHSMEPAVPIQCTAITCGLLIYTRSSVHAREASSFSKQLISSLQTHRRVHHQIEYHNTSIADFKRNRWFRTSSNTIDDFVLRALPRSMHSADQLMSHPNIATDRRSPRGMVASQAPVH